MISVFDVAAYILEKQAPKEDGDSLTTWKLQKLVYYAQAWSAVWDDERLFPERVEAWANGPVCPALYKEHVGRFKIDSLRKGSPSKLKKRHRETVDEVLRFYGRRSAQYLSELSHAERPWQEARKGMAPSERGNKEITVDAMAEYYGSL